MKKLISLVAAFLLSACSKPSVQPQPVPLPAVKAQASTAETPPEDAASQLSKLDTYEPQIAQLCAEIGDKLGSVNASDCNSLQMQSSGIVSVQQRPLALREFASREREPLGRVLVIGGIHGDEYASVSIVFKWMQRLEREYDGSLHWRFIPLANPDGLLRPKSQRPNHNGVDLNRNFPSSDWDRLALHYWHSKTYRNARRYPGPSAASEPETRGLIEQIEQFKPDIIVSVHAPYHLLDYDGPSQAPEKIGSLHLHELGVYPGSLGNYGGIDLQLPVVTLELPSAGIMPKPQEINAMWRDLNHWLLKERLRVAEEKRLEQRQLEGQAPEEMASNR